MQISPNIDKSVSTIIITQKMIKSLSREDNETFREFISRGLGGAEIISIKRISKGSGYPSFSYKVEYIPVDNEEDSESIVTPATPAVTSTTPTMETSQNDSKSDTIIDYIMQQIKNNKEKQIQNAQMEYTTKQQEAEKIVKDLEDFIKKNTNNA